MILRIHLETFQFAHENLLNRIPALFSRVAHCHQGQWFRGMACDEFGKGHDDDIMTFPRCVSIQVQKQEHLVWESVLLPYCRAIHWFELDGIKSVTKHVNRLSDTLDC